MIAIDDGKKSLYWIDALGVEYLGYIQAAAKDFGLHIFVQIGRAVLPILTYLNKDFYDGWKGITSVLSLRFFSQDAASLP